MGNKNHIQISLRKDQIEVLNWKLKGETPGKALKTFIKEQIMFWQLQKLKAERKLKEEEEKNEKQKEQTKPLTQEEQDNDPEWKEINQSLKELGLQ